MEKQTITFMSPQPKHQTRGILLASDIQFVDLK